MRVSFKFLIKFFWMLFSFQKYTLFKFLFQNRVKQWGKKKVYAELKIKFKYKKILSFFFPYHGREDLHKKPCKVIAVEEDSTASHYPIKISPQRNVNAN